MTFTDLLKELKNQRQRLDDDIRTIGDIIRRYETKPTNPKEVNPPTKQKSAAQNSRLHSLVQKHTKVGKPFRLMSLPTPRGAGKHYRKTTIFTEATVLVNQGILDRLGGGEYKRLK
ncbi:MAG: hypothetical protein GY906_22620 [bacterium]|nr:hypothetical protein [bacterium]